MGRQRNVGPKRPQGAEAVPLELPAPYDALSDSPNLIDTERADLAACEAAIDGLRVAFWAAGKALQIIRDARLYRGSYPTFEDYCSGRWQMRRAHADRLIRAWPLAEMLSPIGLTELNEGQVRELLPVAGKHGDDAAAVVYEAAYHAAAETDGEVRVTAAVLKGAVGVLDINEFDRDEAIQQIRDYVARLAAGETIPEDDASTADTWAIEADRVRAAFRKTLTRGIRSAAKANPTGARELVAELRAILDEVETAL